MEIAEVNKIAIAALRTNKTRSFLTMLGIIIGIASVILLVSIGKGLETYITQQLEDLGGNSVIVIPGEFEIHAGGGGGFQGAGVAAPKFTFNHLKAIQREAKTVKASMAYIENNATIRYKGKIHITQVAGVGPEYPEVRNQKTTTGSFFTVSQYNSAKKVVLLGKSAAEELFNHENPVGKKITISDQRFTVIGVLEEKGAFSGVDLDDQLFIPATTSMRVFELEYIQSFWVQSESAQTVLQTKEEVEKILSKSLKDDEFSILDTKSILATINQILGVLTAALGGIAAISLVVGGVGIMNIMLVSVTERTHEIGLRKAVGATPKNILSQFLTEAIVLAILGGIIGILLGVGGSMIINRFFTTTVTLWSVVTAFGVSTLVGLVFGVAPAIKAAKLNPIDALRYE